MFVYQYGWNTNTEIYGLQTHNQKVETTTTAKKNRIGWKYIISPVIRYLMNAFQYQPRTVQSAIGAVTDVIHSQSKIALLYWKCISEYIFHCHMSFVIHQKPLLHTTDEMRSAAHRICIPNEFRSVVQFNNYY